jgi:hypothetical protein
VRELFDLDAVTRRYEAVYHELVQSPRDATGGVRPKLSCDAI